MAQIKPFATVDDYESVYGTVAVTDRDRVTALLARATGYLLAKAGDYTAGEDDVLDLNLSTVCLAMVRRAMSAPRGMEGVSQFQQTAGSYTASVSMLDQYMRPLPSELDLLGFDSGAVFSAQMVG